MEVKGLALTGAGDTTQQVTGHEDCAQQSGLQLAVELAICLLEVTVVVVADVC